MNGQKRGYHLTQHDQEISSENDQNYHHYQNKLLERDQNSKFRLDGEVHNSSSLALENDENVPNNSTPKAPKKKAFFKNTAKRMKIFGSVKKKKSSDADGNKHLVVLSETLSGETADFVTVDNSFDQGIGRKNNKTKKKEKRKKLMPQGCENVECTVDFSNGVFPTSSIDHDGIPEPGVTFRSPLLSVEASLRKKVRQRRMVDIAYQGAQSQSLQYNLQPALSNNFSMEMVPGHPRREANKSGMRSIQEVAMKRSTIPHNHSGEIKGGITEVGDHAVALSREIKLQARNAQPQGTQATRKIMKNHETGSLGKFQKNASRKPNVVNDTGEAMTAVSELSMGSPMAKFDRGRLQYLLNQSNVPMATTDTLEAPEKEAAKRKEIVESPLVQRTRSEYGFCACPINNFDYREVINMERMPARGKRKIRRHNSITSYDNSCAKETRGSYSTSTEADDFSIECNNNLKTASTLTSNSSEGSQDPSEDDESCSVSTGPPDFHSIIYDVTSCISSKKYQIQRKIPNSVSDASAATRRAVQSFRGRLAECIAPVTHSPPSLKARVHRKR